MNKALAGLTERNLLKVFGQVDSARRAAAIAQLYTADRTFFRGGGRGRRPRSAQREGQR
jgi:hypothetical protein